MNCTRAGKAKLFMMIYARSRSHHSYFHISVLLRYLLTLTPSGPGQSVTVSKYVLSVTLFGNMRFAISVTASKLSL